VPLEPVPVPLEPVPPEPAEEPLLPLPPAPTFRPKSSNCSAFTIGKGHSSVLPTGAGTRGPLRETSTGPAALPMVAVSDARTSLALPPRRGRTVTTPA